MGWRPTHLIYHDYGVKPGIDLSKTADNPYHALVYPDGTIRYRNEKDPYGGPAPHAAGMNGTSIGLSYAGVYGEQPTPQGLAALQRERENILKRFPDLTAESHGEAYKRTKGTPQQASVKGRDLKEASWRTALGQRAALAAGTGDAPGGLGAGAVGAPGGAPGPMAGGAPKLIQEPTPVPRPGPVTDNRGMGAPVPMVGPRQPEAMQNRGLTAQSGLTPKVEPPRPPSYLPGQTSMGAPQTIFTAKNSIWGQEGRIEAPAIVYPGSKGSQLIVNGLPGPPTEKQWANQQVPEPSLPTAPPPMDAAPTPMGPDPSRAAGIQAERTIYNHQGQNVQKQPDERTATVPDSAAPPKPMLAGGNGAKPAGAAPAGPQWMDNPTFGKGIQWSDGSQSFGRGGGGSFAPGVAAKASPQPTGTPQTKFKGFGGFFGG